MPALPSVEIVEKPFSIEDMKRNYASGRLVEVFISGTASGILPIKSILVDDR